MSTTRGDGGPAFPDVHEGQTGMSLRDWFAGQALANATICTGRAEEWQLRAWFGDRGGITREEISAKQAIAHADAMLTARFS